MAGWKGVNVGERMRHRNLILFALRLSLSHFSQHSSLLWRRLSSRSNPTLPANTAASSRMSAQREPPSASVPTQPRPMSVLWFPMRSLPSTSPHSKATPLRSMPLRSKPLKSTPPKSILCPWLPSASSTCCPSISQLSPAFVKEKRPHREIIFMVSALFPIPGRARSLISTKTT